MEEYNGGTPMNARIRIDYTGKKPKVKFTFPNRKEQYDQGMFEYIFWFWLIINIPTIVAINFITNKLVIIILVSQVLIIPFLINFLFKKQLAAITPDFMAFISKKKKTIFKPKDILEDMQEGYYCEIPLFNNILLDYIATKDFSKFLTLFEIREHNFRYVIGKRKVNDGIWYARFYFKDKPKDGELEVLFK